MATELRFKRMPRTLPIKMYIWHVHINFLTGKPGRGESPLDRVTPSLAPHAAHHLYPLVPRFWVINSHLSHYMHGFIKQFGQAELFLKCGGHWMGAKSARLWNASIVSL